MADFLFCGFVDLLCMLCIKFLLVMCEARKCYRKCYRGRVICGYMRMAVVLMNSGLEMVFIGKLQGVNGVVVGC